MQPEVSVVIVSWRVREQTLACLQALPAALDGLTYEAILVDNASGDGTASAVRARFPWVRLVVNERNRLYAAAANQGLALARGRYRLLLNPDVIPHPHSIVRLIQYADAHPQAGLLGPRIVDAEGRDDWRTGRHYPSPWSEFVDWSGLGRWSPFIPFLAKNRRLSYDKSVTSAVPLLSGACLLFSPQLPASLRQLNPDFPMYGEDIDLCRRMDCAGFQKVLVAEAGVTHVGGASSSQRPIMAALMAMLAMNRYFTEWEGPAAARLHRVLMGLVGLIKSSIFCAASLVNVHWQGRCAIYRMVLKWAIGGGVDDIVSV